MSKNKISKTQMGNLVKGVINEQINVFVCEPGTCACVMEMFPNQNVTTYSSQQICRDDLTNCCTRWKCDPVGAGVCEPTGDPNAPFASESECLSQYPQGCQTMWYDCNQSTGYQCQQVNYNSGMDQTQCNSTYPNGCPPQTNYTCDVGQCVCYADPNGSFTGPTAQSDCQDALSDPAHDCCCKGNCGGMFDCVDRDGSMVCLPSPTGFFPTLTDCNNCIANPNCPECNDPEDRYSCIDEVDEFGNPTGGKICVIDPNGIFATEQDCLDCVVDPACERCNVGDPVKWDCVLDGIEPGGPVGPGKGPMPTKGDLPIEIPITDVGGGVEKGMLREQQVSMICVQSATGSFNSEVDCLNCVADPDCEECNEGGGGWECIEPGGCQNTGQGPYADQATCEANTDDHYNMGFCDCNCPGQPAGCDAEPLISPVPIINGEYNGMHGQPYMVGNVDLNLNDAKDKDGPLLTQAFRDRMAPCGPSYNAPGGKVKHDCAFWEFISTKKLPDKYSSVIHPSSQGGLANPQAENPWHMAHSTAPLTGGTALGGYPFLPWVPDPVTGVLGPQIHATTGLPINPYGGTQSTTAHPRWQRRLEAKIAYVRCLRRNCCNNTEWPADGEVFSPFM